MDPVSVFGIASGALQTIHFIASSINTLCVLRGKYAEAERTIQNLVSVLSTIETALSRLRQWIQRDARDSLENPDCLRSLDVGVQGCLAAMEAFWDDINQMVPTETDSDNLGSRLGFRARAKIVWNDQKMNDHYQRLQLQVFSLQLFLQVCQCQTSSEQLELLRREENRKLIQRVADDTATLRSARSTANSVADASSISGQSAGSSSVGPTVFDFDDTVVDSTAYRSVMQQRLKPRRDENPENSSNAVFRNPSVATLATVDEGYASGFASRQDTVRSSLRVSPASGGQEESPAISPIERRQKPAVENVSRRNTTALGRSSSLAYFPSRRSKSARNSSSLRRSGSAREVFRAAFNRVSHRSSGPGSLPTSPVDARPLRRNREGESNVSIETSSASGVTAPPVVKAAQRGALTQVEAQIKGGANIEARHDESGRTALAVAAHCGKEEVVDLFLKYNADVHSRDASFMTPLHLAASRGHLGVVDRLIEATGNIDARDSQGRTPFWIAVEAGHIETAEILLGSGCTINSRGGDQMTPLHCASSQGDLEIVLFLLRNRIDIHAKDAAMKTALHYASEAGHTGVVDKLLSGGAKIEAPGEYQTTPLICAAVMGKGLTTQLLLKRGAAVSACDENGMSALHWAAFNGQLETVESLLAKKASLTSATNLGRTALHLAILGKQFAIVEYLLRKGAQTEAACHEGLTALHYSCKSNDVSIVRLLLASGANIEALTGQSQRRAIHVAVQAGSLEIVMLLKVKGAQIHCEDRDGNKPLCLACRSGQVEVVRLLLSAGASPQLQPSTETQGNSPICLAAAVGRTEIVRLLLDAGASTSECDHMGWNPLLYSAHYGHVPLLSFLLSRCDLTAKQGLVLSFPSVGFAPNIHIQEDCKENVKKQVLDVSAELARRRMPVDYPNLGITPPISPFQEGLAGHSTPYAPVNLPVATSLASSRLGAKELESSDIFPLSPAPQAELRFGPAMESENPRVPTPNGRDQSPGDPSVSRVVIQHPRPRALETILSSVTRTDSPESVTSLAPSSVSQSSMISDSSGHNPPTNEYMSQVPVQRDSSPFISNPEQRQTNGNGTSGIVSGNLPGDTGLTDAPPLTSSVAGPVEDSLTEPDWRFEPMSIACYELDGGGISDSQSVASFETVPEFQEGTVWNGNVQSVELG